MSRYRTLAILVVLQMVIFLISLPGFGIETRTTGQYAPWAGPIFLVLTILVFAFGIAALAVMRSRTRTFVRLASAQAVVAVATNLFDFSHVGGPAPPIGPFVLGVIALFVALAEIAVASRSGH
ncbi:MAG TPA: hypothetical protein VGV89_09110 [Thermoplasmata archaeon]|nr:hypothetical protein [Thermoplasmata archaeon]